MGLAIPLVVARSTALGASNGLLVTNREAFESAHKVDRVLMDKTGTLTEGNFKVNRVLSLDESYTENQVLQYFAALEQASSHPLAQGILEEAHQRSLDYDHASDVHTLPGVGMEGMLNGQKVLIVSEKYLRDEGIAYDTDAVKQLASLGNSMSYLLVEGVLVGLIAQGDTIKEASYGLIQSLQRQGIEAVMVTGDNEYFAQSVAKELGITSYYSEALPEDKERIVHDLQKQGHRVMMVGDGVNDAPSLARADIGVAIGAGTDVAIDSADLVLVKSNPSDILHLLNLSKNTSRKMVQNLWWGAGYNFIAIPLAAGVLAFAGINLTPAVGALLMSMSTVIVAINAMLLRMK